MEGNLPPLHLSMKLCVSFIRHASDDVSSEGLSSQSLTCQAMGEYTYPANFLAPLASRLKLWNIINYLIRCTVLIILV